MIAPIGFDLAPFLPRQGSPAIEMAGRVMGANAEQNAGLQQATNALLRQKALREQLAFEREQLTEQGRQFDMNEMNEMLRQQFELEQAARIDAMNRAKAQRDLEAGLVGDATKAFGVGDTVAMDAVQSRAAVQAPALDFSRRLAPELSPMGLMSESAVFGQDPEGLAISRGGMPLFRDETASARKRQQEVARQSLSPLIGVEGGSFDPFVTAALNTAGTGGLSGKDAASTALKAGGDAAQRRQSGINAQSIAMSRNDTAARAGAGQEMDYWDKLHQRVEAIGNQFLSSNKLGGVKEASDATATLMAQIDSPDPWSQNMAQLGVLKNAVKGAASDRDMANIQGAAGFLNKLERDMDYFLRGGEVPANFREQIKRGLELVNQHNQLRIHRVGLEAMDHVYQSPGIMAMVRSPQEAAQFGLQAYHKITGTPVTSAEVEEEAKRIVESGLWGMKQSMGTSMPASMGGGGRSGGGVSVRAGGQLADPAILDSLGGLGTSPLPPKPKFEGQATDDAAALELLRNAGQ